MAELTPITLFVPILFLVVLKLSDISREIDLVEARGNAGWGVPFWSMYDWAATLPNLGRFNFIHFANYFMLLYAFIFTTFEVESGSIKTMLLIFIGLIWVVLPIFELTEYDRISSQKEGQHPSSFKIHYYFAFVLAAFIILWYRLRNFIKDIIPTWIEFPFLFISGLMIICIICAGAVIIEKFLHRLDEELLHMEE